MREGFVITSTNATVSVSVSVNPSDPTVSTVALMIQHMHQLCKQREGVLGCSMG